MQFSRLELKDFTKYNKYWEKCPEQSMDYTFVNLWGWQDHHSLYHAYGEHLCWIQEGAQQQGQIPTFRAPIGDWNKVNWQEEPLLKNGAILTRVPEKLVHILEEALPSRVQKEEVRGQWEYLYKQEDLAKLPGNRYHKKRNHVNAYKKHYGEVDYRAIDAKIIEDMLALQDEWCQWHECSNSPSLQAENIAVNKVFAHWEELPMLIGGAIYIDSTLVGFSVGEVIANNVLGVHFEKGRSGYRGVYQTMNTFFVQNAGVNCELINREQDLDEEGLRQAKLSYLPVDFLRKYTLTILP